MTSKRNIIRFVSLVILAFMISNGVNAQSKANVSGKIFGPNHIPLPNCSIILTSILQVITDTTGSYHIEVPANKQMQLIISHIGFKPDTMTLYLHPGEHRIVDLFLNSLSVNLNEIIVSTNQHQSQNFTSIDPRLLNNITTSSNAIESLIKTLPGVVTNNESSAQYMVRGGNFDENLVYINDIEVYRPMLIRAGIQEGLSIINPDLVSGVHFSTGGFDARYGDKMSSVLDISYRHPDQFGGSLSASLLGSDIHLEGESKNKKFTYLSGFRYKTNRYIQNAMETKGEYNPFFLDFQALITYKINPKLDISFLGYASSNSYKLKPQSRQTTFGTLTQPLRLIIYFDGNESDQYNNLLGGITLTYKHTKNTLYKIIISSFNSKEKETFDVLGQYWLALLSNSGDPNDLAEVIETKGVGSYLNHARNYLDMIVTNAELKGISEINDHTLQWGFKFQYEHINDHLKEWTLIDSSGYSLPHFNGFPGQVGNQRDLLLNSSVTAFNLISSNRITGYAEDSWKPMGKNLGIIITAGARFEYWDVNKETLFSPRGSITYQPRWNDNLQLRFATGYYFQPPFYREMRDPTGVLNKNIKAQESIHFVLGYDWKFMAWGRPFKLTNEFYYKTLKNLIPYSYDNIRIIYSAKNDSKGYAKGLDLKVNGEFVPSIDSWISLSVMKTEEDILDDFYYNYYDKNGKIINPNLEKPVDSVIHHPGYFARPTDQRVTFGMFFQDYLPRNPSYKVNIGIYFGTGLPTGAPNTPYYTHTLRMPFYRRVDIGFSKQIIGPGARTLASNFLHSVKSMWITAEIYNLLQVNNTSSYTWVRDYENNQYGVPNYLTPRQVNVRLRIGF